MRNIIQNIIVIYAERRDMKTKKVEVVKDKWDGLVTLEISHNGWQTIVVNDLDMEDLKKLRKVIDEFIRNHENN